LHFIAITGARGVGKTTFLLQHIKENLSEKPDEVHKYKDWSREIKNVYDYFSDLQIIITGSSTLDIYKGSADLSRRAILYKMNGLSFRKFIELKYSQAFPVITFDEILSNPADPIREILNKVKPIRLFEEYLQSGFYPFFTEGESEYPTRLKQTINHVLESDLPNAERIDFYAVHHLRKLFSILAELVPYKPNIVKLSSQVGVSRETLIKYLHLLDKAELVMLLQSNTTGKSKTRKQIAGLKNAKIKFHYGCSVSSTEKMARRLDHWEKIPGYGTV
jgi:hypothetical protein